jgi:hypothetical protein
MKIPEVNQKGYWIIWTEEMDSFVQDLLYKGKSFGFIADKLGITRNSVIGRVHRLRKKTNGK